MLWLNLILCTAPVAEAGGARPGVNTAERLDNQADQADDRRDLQVLVGAVDDWKRAIGTGDRASALAADRRIDGWLERELVESRREVGEARRETRRSSRELRGSRREAVGPGAKDQYDKRDDRRDRSDDRADQGQARFDYEKTKSIHTQLTAMQPAFVSGTATPADVKRKRDLYGQLTALAMRELNEGREEIREDRTETKEDRWERRERR